MIDYRPVEGDPFMFSHIDGTYIFAKPMAEAVFTPIQKMAAEPFTAFCDREISSADLVANGPIYSVASMFSYVTMQQIDPKDVNTNGFVYIDGKLVDGRSSPQGFYINYDGQYHFGEGNPRAPHNAFGGLGPLLIRDYRPSANFLRPVTFNDVNVYNSQVEPTPEPVVRGEPRKEHEDNLLSRSNNTIAEYGAGQGIMAIGCSSETGLLYVLIRDNGVSSENEISSAIEHFRHLRCDNAVFLDGSTSVTCRTKKKYYATPDTRKDNSIEIGFKIS